MSNHKRFIFVDVAMIRRHLVRARELTQVRSSVTVDWRNREWVTVVAPLLSTAGPAEENWALRLRQYIIPLYISKARSAIDICVLCFLIQKSTGTGVHEFAKCSRKPSGHCQRHLEKQFYKFVDTTLLYPAPLPLVDKVGAREVVEMPILLPTEALAYDLGFMALAQRAAEVRRLDRQTECPHCCRGGAAARIAPQPNSARRHIDRCSTLHRKRFVRRRLH